MNLPLSREQFETARAKLKAKGIEVDGDQGTVRHKGFVVNFSYTSGWLVLTVANKPWLVSMSKVESAIKEWFQV